MLSRRHILTLLVASGASGTSQPRNWRSSMSQWWPGRWRCGPAKIKKIKKIKNSSTNQSSGTCREWDMMIRDEVRDFHRLGPLPSEQDESEGADERLEEAGRLLDAIERPVTDEEARPLAESFGEDNCFGLAWTLLHLIETAPSPVVTAEPPEGSNLWIETLWTRYRNTLADQRWSSG